MEDDEGQWDDEDHCIIRCEGPDVNQSLSYLLSRRFRYGMPEELIAIVLRAALTGLRSILELEEEEEEAKKREAKEEEAKEEEAKKKEAKEEETKKEEAKEEETKKKEAKKEEAEEAKEEAKKEEKEKQPDIRAGLISIYWSGSNIREGIRVCYERVNMNRGPDFLPDVGIKGVGLLALELAYGPLPETPQERETIAANFIRILHQRMPREATQMLDEEFVSHRELNLTANQNFQGFQEPNQYREFSPRFLDLVLACLNQDFPSSVHEILEHPFVRNVRSFAYFERRAR